MALDVYVMPLWRYLAGDYEKAQARFGADAGSRALSVSPADARTFVARLRNGFRDVSRNAMRWHDRGEPVFAKPFNAESWNALRAFAADQQYPVERFNFGKEAHRHPGLHEVLYGNGSAFEHTVKQHETGGFYLPVDFARPMELTVRDDASSTILAGSSLALLRAERARAARWARSRPERARARRSLRRPPGAAAIREVRLGVPAPRRPAQRAASVADHPARDGGVGSSPGSHELNTATIATTMTIRMNTSTRIQTSRLRLRDPSAMATSTRSHSAVADSTG